MSEKKTVFVVGAGASYEVGLPVGSDLKDKIASLLDIQSETDFYSRRGDVLLLNAIQQCANDEYEKSNPCSHNSRPNGLLQPYIKSAQKIRDSMPLTLSIDNFIHEHQGNECIEICGKLAIVRAILKAEHGSKLFFDKKTRTNINFRALGKSWFNPFFQLLTENCRAEQLQARLKSVAFVIFNYDRCLEHFLYHAFQTVYDFTPNEAANLVKSMSIYHPYGTVGDLPYDAEEENRVDFIGYGEQPKTPFQLIHLAKNIKTFTEGFDSNDSSVATIQENISQADKMIFLGFGYNSLNLDITQPTDGRHINDNVSYLGTAHGLSSSDRNETQIDISKRTGLSKTSIKLEHGALTCCELFQDYQKFLSFSDATSTHTYTTPTTFSVDMG